jgi:hypothetical protein
VLSHFSAVCIEGASLSNPLLIAAVYGGAMLPPAGSAAREAKLPPGSVSYAGSFMVLVSPTLDNVCGDFNPTYTGLRISGIRIESS